MPSASCIRQSSTRQSTRPRICEGGPIGARTEVCSGRLVVAEGSSKDPSPSLRLGTGAVWARRTWGQSAHRPSSSDGCARGAEACGEGLGGVRGRGCARRPGSSCRTPSTASSRRSAISSPLRRGPLSVLCALFLVPSSIRRSISSLSSAADDGCRKEHPNRKSNKEQGPGNSEQGTE